MLERYTLIFTDSKGTISAHYLQGTLEVIKTQLEKELLQIKNNLESSMTLDIIDGSDNSKNVWIKEIIPGIFWNGYSRKQYGVFSIVPVVMNFVEEKVLEKEPIKEHSSTNFVGVLDELQKTVQKRRENPRPFPPSPPPLPKMKFSPKYDTRTIGGELAKALSVRRKQIEGVNK